MAAYSKVLYLGSATAGRQMAWGIPSGKASGQPGVLVLPTGAATPTEYKLFVDTGGNLRITSGTAFGDSDGTAFASGAGANTALTNLAAVAINTSLVSDGVNLDDLGSDALPWKSLYVRTSLIFDQATRNLTITASEPADSARTVNFPDPGANVSVAYLTTSQAFTTKTYNGLTVACASANQFILSSGTSSITMTEGNTDILLAAGAQLDIAGSKLVDIDQNFSVTTEAVTLNQSLSTTDDVTFDALTVTSITDGTITITGGALTGFTTIGTTGAITCRGITNTVTAISSNAEIGVNADNIYITVGASGSTDARIYFDGDDLCLWDSKTSTAYTLQQLATGTTLNPYIVGDLTIGEGKLNWIDAVDEVAATWGFAGTTNDSIAITAASNTTGNVLSITSNSTTTNGALIYCASSLTAGYFVELYNGAANVFTVGRYGAAVIGGNASTDVLTLTAGDVKVTAGDIRLTDGIITVDMDADEISYFKKGFATATAAVVEIENTHVDSTGPCLLLDQNATGNAMALQITHDGDYAAIDISAPVARTGNVINITMANQLAQKAIAITGAATSANNAGVIDVTVTGATAGALFYAKQSTGIPAATSHLFWGTSQGDIAAANVGSVARFEESGAAQAGSYTLYATSTANNGALINTAAVAMSALTLTGPEAQVASILYVSGLTGTGWDGADGVGMVHIVSDAANTFLHANTSCLLIQAQGTTAAGQLGAGLRLVDTTTAGAGTNYSAYINSTNIYGLYVGTGAIAAGNVVLRGIEAQTAAMLTVDGSTGTGWTGAATLGMVDLACDGATVSTTASVLQIRVGAGTPANTAAGYAIRVADTTAAAATALTTYAVYISAANNEAIKVDDGLVVCDDGVCTKVAGTDVSNPPTNANMISAFGAVATLTTGFLGLIDDANAGSKLYLCAMVNGKYWQTELTAGA